VSASRKLGEAEAQRIAEEVLGLTLTKRPDDGAYDFDMRDEGGRLVGALEVTLATDPADHAFDAALDKHGPFPAVPAAREWNVWLASLSADVRRIRDDLPEVLAALEDSNVHRFHLQLQPPAPPLAAKLEALGVASGRSYETGSSPEITLLEPGGGGARGPELINQVAVEMVADKQRQLSAARDAGAPEQHLFIWVTAASSRYLTWVTLWEDRPPAGPPTLPPEQAAVVTTIWVTARNSGTVVLWHVTPPGDWVRSVIEPSLLPES